MKKGISIKIKDTIKELNNSNALKKESVTRIAVSVNAENVQRFSRFNMLNKAKKGINTIERYFVVELENFNLGVSFSLQK